jgi:hypothetical protein
VKTSYRPGGTFIEYSPDGDVVVVVTSPVVVFLMRTSRPARGPRTLDSTPRNSPVPVCACTNVLQAQTRARIAARWKIVISRSLIFDW